ncbi:hypothetical protein D3218_09010 [Aureimonas flava]|uniref:Uncharacterized protein n=1 Tax=Aureimonas flava TaxID=2320271 RepID=A0A3A1WJZ8_9HYPH|nr:hypothetical protein [Aureimonas flava]RIY01479.1 hypothetical protein D3218_09010 [Aureimonas flava]
MSLDPASIAADDRSFIAARLGAHPTKLQSNENDPASAPTLPGHSSSYPEQETAMNNVDSYMGAVRHTMPKSMAKGLSTLHDIDAFSTLSIQEIYALRSLLKTMIEVSAGLVSQPRCYDQAGNYNNVGEYIQATMYVLDSACDVLDEEVRGRQPKKRTDAQIQAEILVTAEMEQGTAWDEIAHLASTGASRVRGFRRGL